MLGKAAATFSLWSIIVIFCCAECPYCHCGQSNNSTDETSGNATFLGLINRMITLKSSMLRATFSLLILCFVDDFIFLSSEAGCNTRGRGILGIAHKNISASKPEATSTTCRTGSCLGHDYRIMPLSGAHTSSTKLNRVVLLLIFNKFV